MATKILGILASAAIIALIAITILHRDRYRSLLPESAEKIEAAEMTAAAATAELSDSTITADTLPTTPDNNL